MRQKRRSYRDGDDDEGAPSDDLAAVNERLDELTRHIERMAQSSAGRRSDERTGEPSADHVAEALARLDRRLDQVISEGRAATHELRARQAYAPPPPPPAPPPMMAPPPAPPAPSRGPANWVAQISARQRALEGGAPVAPPSAAPSPPIAPAMPAYGPAADFAGLEHQLRQINSQIAALHQPYGDAFAALRSDLADVGRALTEAVPRRAMEALEAQVRALGERIDRSKQAGADGAILGGVEHGLAEVRDALRRLTPAEGLAGFDEAVRALSHKIDQIGTGQAGDPAAFRQLEQAVLSLRNAMANVASEGAISQLAAEVHGLAARFERAAAESSSDALGKLEARIAALMETGRAMPPELEGAIRSLSERLDRMTLSQGDQLAMGSLEDRITKLSEKLDAADSRLTQLGALERGMADLLVHLEEMRNGGSRGLRAASRAEAPPEPPPAPPQPAVLALPTPAAQTVPPAPAMAPSAPASPLDLISPEGKTPEASPPSLAPARHAPPPAEPTAAAPAFRPPPPAVVEPHRVQPNPNAAPRGPQPRRPLDPDLPPDTPIEPGTGTPRRMRSGSAAARIAASEAALGMARPGPEETGGKSAAIAAARSAAKSAYLDSPVKVPKSFTAMRPSWLKWPWPSRPKQAVAVPAPETAAPQMAAAPEPEIRMPEPQVAGREEGQPRGGRVLKVLKTLLIAASVTIIIVGAALTLMDLLMPGELSAPPAIDAPAPAAPPSPPVPSRPMPTPGGAMLPPMPAPSAPDRDTTGSIERTPSFFEPSTVIAPPKYPAADITGSIARPATTPGKPPAAAIPAQSGPSAAAAAALPASISPTLRSAVAANEPAAEYEIGSRYADGRGLPQNLPEAARWLERAANAGFVPAQFRLAGLNEKGDGVKKDLQAARRLYLSAANRGHAKAMHNLAVLYAEGVDGRPDYKLAAQWFRKAAGYGIADSQYNLAILYARGIGVESNLAESYKWFALAAGSGDADAAKKRDEVGSRLDQQTLMAARLATQTFTPDREPDDATSLKAPPGGWDRPPAHPVKPKPRTPASPAQ